MREALKHGAWDQFTADKYHQSSPKLAKFLIHYLDSKKPVIDFGCGKGYYINELASVGFRCIGVEGFELNNFLHMDIKIMDLCKPIKWVPAQVLSFETGEHIPRSSEQIFLNTLTDNCEKKLIMSWAKVGQPGIGHVNCRNHDYIIDQIQKRGFKLNEPDTLDIRKNVDPECDWLERNLLIFDRV
jgi:hypothetical protein